MRFCTLSSCSYANSIVVQDRQTCVLVDCGLRKRDIKPFLAEVGLTPGDLDAVLITHCHVDHVYGLKYLLKERTIPVYSSSPVLKQLRARTSFCGQQDFRALSPVTPEKIGTLTVNHFRLSHDVETIGFTICGDGEKMGFITDTGFVPDYCLQAFKTVDYLYIESNHDLEMYKYSKKPPHVIRRNLGSSGHLSNDQCGQALKSMGLSNCKLVVLGHLSEEDNEPRRAIASARRFLPPGIPLRCAPSRIPGPWS
ncbi:MAG TPA: MBL fold metallo-hydrolase [Bacillota bacterium]|nr:MBL fold metallo-hydrolase [Peptococcaceae bacterium MAG4]NLW37935.1 MBL fold metallo-hydrolase [Peptococcaceae bacterium]HPZ42908.1 MBL fold metallo-hydrolase [Bacillota bacterium]HQD75399.1 MBL fold metallo-hydrolase [Bacillota bacterium]HUM58150.1 MBL fold metallo-hydrolase [Bacillota bacterium]